MDEKPLCEKTSPPSVEEVQNETWRRTFARPETYDHRTNTAPSSGRESSNTTQAPAKAPPPGVPLGPVLQSGGPSGLNEGSTEFRVIPAVRLTGQTPAEKAFIKSTSRITRHEVDPETGVRLQNPHDEAMPIEIFAVHHKRCIQID